MDVSRYEHIVRSREIGPARPVLLFALTLGSVATACAGDPEPLPVRDAELEAIRNTRMAGLAVYAPVHMVSPDQIGRCRVDPRRGIRFDGEFDRRALERQFVLRRALVSAWSEDAQLVRAEIRCDAERLAVAIDTTWYSESLREVLHGEDPQRGVPVGKGGPRPELSVDEVAAALDARAQAWGAPIVVRAAAD